MSFDDIEWTKVLKWGGISAGIVVLISVLLFVLIGSGKISEKTMCEDNSFVYDEDASVCVANKKYIYDKIAVVVGNTANSPAPNFTSEITPYIKNSLLNNLQEKNSLSDLISVYSADGRHKKIELSEPKIRSGSNTERMIENINKQFNSLNQDIKQSPTSDGAAYIDAIASASRSLRGSDKPLLIVIGSGISDSGTLNFADNSLIDISAKTVLANLEQSGAINENAFSNVKIIWTGIGDVIEPQNSLDSGVSDKIEDIYSAVLYGMGAEEVSFNGGTLSGESVDTNGFTVKPMSKNIIVIDCTEDEVQFKAGSDVIINPEEAAAVIAKKTEAIKPGNKIKVVGYVAIGICGSDADTNLSQRRANAIKNLLINAGVNANDIIAIGEGKGPKNECLDKKDGEVQNEEIAKQNRKVTIVIERRA